MQDKQITILDADSSLGQNKNATNVEIKCINGTNCIKILSLIFIDLQN